MANIESSGRGKRCRTVWVSDVHLGTRACQAEALLAFLDAHPCERLYLVGDIFDGWKLGRGWYWSEAQSRLVLRILDCVLRGTDVIYVPGNHDHALRTLGRILLAGVRVKPHLVHELADGRRALVLHGDQFDGIVSQHRFLANLGDRLYTLALAANRTLNAVLNAFGCRPRSFSGYLKQRVKDACNYVSDFEERVGREAARWGVDVVICGHIHKAEMRRVGNVLYVNDGDWVESCTGLVETQDGALELYAWSGGRERLLAVEHPVAAPRSMAEQELALAF